MNLLNSKVKKCHQHNLTKEQWKGLMELRKNPEIVIKKADKGSAVVIMNTTDYLREGYIDNSVTVISMLKLGKTLQNKSVIKFAKSLLR